MAKYLRKRFKKGKTSAYHKVTVSIPIMGSRQRYGLLLREHAPGLGRGTPQSPNGASAEQVRTQQRQPRRRRSERFHSQCQADSPVHHREVRHHRELLHRLERDHWGQMQAQEPDNEGLHHVGQRRNRIFPLREPDYRQLLGEIL